jgi:hypothetical protein
VENNTINFLGTLLLLSIICAGFIVLQVFLSKKESLWIGLILPIISLGISVFAALGVLFMSAHTGTSSASVDGVVIETETLFNSTASIFGSTVLVFFLFNISTIVFVAIYLAYRGKRNRQRALEKMSVQDIE